MPKFKKLTKFVKGKPTEFEIHIDGDGVFYVKNPPKEIIETLKLNRISAYSFGNLEDLITMTIIDFHKAIEQKRKVIIYRAVIGNDCRKELSKIKIDTSKLSGRFNSSISGYGFEFEWIVAYEVDLGNSKSYKRFKTGPIHEHLPDGPKWEDKPFEELPQVGHIYDDQFIVDYSVELENFFEDLKSATIGLTAKLASIFGNTPENLLQNINQRLIGTGVTSDNNA